MAPRKMVEIRNIDKIKVKKREQRTYNLGFLIIVSIFSLLFGILIGFSYKDFFKEVLKIFPFL